MRLLLLVVPLLLLLLLLLLLSLPLLLLASVVNQLTVLNCAIAATILLLLQFGSLSCFHLMQGKTKTNIAAVEEPVTVVMLMAMVVIVEACGSWGAIASCSDRGSGSDSGIGSGNGDDDNGITVVELSWVVHVLNTTHALLFAFCLQMGSHPLPPHFDDCANIQDALFACSLALINQPAYLNVEG